MDNLIAIKTKRDKKWTHLNLSCIEDKTLSWKAKAIHTYMISRPPNWQIKSTDLESRSTDGRISLLSGLKELIKLHYIARIVRRDDKRRVVQYGYIAFDTQQTELPELEPPWEYVKPTDTDTKSVDELQAENMITAFDPPIINNRTEKEQKNNEHSFLRKEVVFSQGENTDDVEGLLAEQRSKLDTKEYLTQSKKQPSRTRTVKSPDTINAEYIIDTLWKEQGLVQHKSGTKTYKTLASIIESMLKGKCAWFKGRKFHRQDFAKSIKQFSLAAFDPDYEVPITSTYKDKLKKMSFLTFIHNDFSANGDASLFLKYLDNDAKLLAEKNIKELCPELTNILIEEYYNNQPNLSKEKANRVAFVKAANKLQTFYESIKPRINSYMTPTTKRLAQWLIEAVFSSTRGREISPNLLRANYIYDEVLPLYLVNQNVIPSKKKKEETVKYKKWVD